MKLLSLHVKRYGHFADASFEFNDNGVQLIVGPNEAGKSTLLEFVREILFGFAERNRYDFGTGRVEGATTMRMSSGQIIELRRHKGRKNTVAVRIDGNETNHDESSFVNLLGGTTANLFRSVFAFGLKELAEADESLKHENVRSALYSGGLANVVNPKRILDSLKSEAETLFKERAQIPIINSLCGKLGNVIKQVKEKSTRPDNYALCRSELEQAKGDADTRMGELSRLRQVHSLTTKLIKALPDWLKLKGLQRERSGLSEPSGFPTDGQQQFATVRAEIDRLSDEQASLIQEIALDADDLTKVVFDPQVIEHKATIESAHRTIQSANEARRDLPLRRADVNEIQRTVREELAELVPSWSLIDLQAFRVDAAGRATLSALVNKLQQLRETRTQLVAQHAEVKTNLSDTIADLSGLKEPSDVSELAALVEREADYTNDVRELRRMQKELSDTERKLAALLLKLNPPLAACENAHRLPVAPAETVATFIRGFAEHRQKLNTAEQSLTEEERNLTALERELTVMRKPGAAVPTRDILDQKRLHRDAGWKLIRRKYVAGEVVDAETAGWQGETLDRLPDLYEQVVRDADGYADGLFDNSAAVAKQRQVEDVRRTIEGKQQMVANCRAALAELTGAWNELWQPCAFVPLEPDAMEGWLERHRNLAELVETRDRFAADVKSLIERVATYEVKLREVVGDSCAECVTLLVAARGRIKAVEATEQDRKTLETAKRRLEAKSIALADQLGKQQKPEMEWKREWQEFLHKLRLPEDWQPELAQEVIGRLNTARVNLGKVPDIESRIAAMNERLTGFETQVGWLCDAIAPDLTDKQPEIAAASLQERLTTAVTAQERHANLKKNVADKTRKRQELDRQLAAVHKRRGELLDKAGAKSNEEFEEVANRAARILELDSTIAAKQRELELVRENVPPETFAAQLDGGDLDLLQQLLAELGIAIENATTLSKEAEQRVGACQESLSRLETGSGEAANLQEQVAAMRAELAVSIDRYAPLLFAQRLLQDALQRFERESQPAMLKEVSRIFNLMTAGHYVRVERPLDDDRPLLVHRLDQEPLEPEQLSTGTREQLYLAIRLAYVLHYCGRAEPMPIIMDDVLANFDDDRATQTLKALGNVAEQVQVIMFTCHPHLVELAKGVFPSFTPAEMKKTSVIAS